MSLAMLAVVIRALLAVRHIGSGEILHGAEVDSEGDKVHTEAVRLVKRREHAPDCGFRGTPAGRFNETGWDSTWKIEARDNHAIGNIFSWHNNKHEDRQFTLEEIFVSPLGYLNSSDSKWSGWLNYFDQKFDYVCPGDSVITGMQSYHSNLREDRRWSVRCSKIHMGTWQGPRWSRAVREESNTNTGWVNLWDKSFWQIREGKILEPWSPEGALLAGIHSEHSNKHEDRRFSFDYKKYCLV